MFDIFNDGYCPQCLLDSGRNEMILNRGDLWECPLCHLQAHSASMGLFAILGERGEGDLKETKATDQIKGRILTRAIPGEYGFCADSIGFSSEMDFREYLELHKEASNQPPPPPSTNTEIIELTHRRRRLNFRKVGLQFIAHGLENLFARKNNKTVQETLTKNRYRNLREMTEQHYAENLTEKLGSFLFGLKSSSDDLYKHFLNSHGDKTYCHFKMAECEEKCKKGIYLYRLEDTIVYVGRSLDPFSKRVDHGYGQIHPKNCYIDGQSTNCRLNALIESHSENITFYVSVLSDDSDISVLEETLIQDLRPIWNVRT